MLTSNECDVYRDFVERHQAYIYPLIASSVLRGTDGEIATVIDMGVGPGHFTVELAKRTGATVHAVDINPRMHELARELATVRGVADRVRFDLEDVHELSYPDAFADLIVSYSCFHHWADPAKGLAECWRVLKPGGRLVIIDTNTGVEAALPVLKKSIPDPAHFRFVEEALAESYPKDRVTALMCAAGIERYALDDFAFSEEDLLENLDELGEMPEGDELPDGLAMCWRIVAEKGANGSRTGGRDREQ